MTKLVQKDEMSICFSIKMKRKMICEYILTKNLHLTLKDIKNSDTDSLDATGVTSLRISGI